MKTCPRCGSVLADNEPYCENCGYDPDFDFGGFSTGRSSYSSRPRSSYSGLDEDIKEFAINVVYVIIFFSIFALLVWGILYIL